MQYIVVDIEADGPIPGMYSMVALGAVNAQSGDEFYAELAPISANFNQNALNACNYTREQTLEFEEPVDVMVRFLDWLKAQRTSDQERLLFVADNAGFDWMFVCWYLHHFLGENPFGHSPMSMTWYYKGVKQDFRANFRHLRITRHSHNALDDARGNAEAFRVMLHKVA